MTKHPNTISSYPEVHSVEKWGVHDFSSPDETYGVPDEHIEQIAKTLLGTLEQMGIDKDKVMFSGYREGESKKDTEHWHEDGQVRDDIKELAEKMVQLDRQGKFDIDPGLKQDYLHRIQALKANLSNQAGTYTYFLSGWERLFDSDVEGTENPLHYASVSDGARIGVYDRAVLGQFAHEDTATTNVLSVQATPEQMKSAKVLEFRPRYTADEPVVSHA